MDIGNRIRCLRQAKGLSVNGLATKAGVSQSYLRAIELGEKHPTVEFLEILCDEGLDISIRDFFNDDTEKLISEDLLVQKVLRMSTEQRNALLEFLNTIGF